jgi:hypothetical protein
MRSFLLLGSGLFHETDPMLQRNHHNIAILGEELRRLDGVLRSGKASKQPKSRRRVPGSTVLMGNVEQANALLEESSAHLFSLLWLQKVMEFVLRAVKRRRSIRPLPLKIKIIP